MDIGNRGGKSLVVVDITIGVFGGEAGMVTDLPRAAPWGRQPHPHPPPLLPPLPLRPPPRPPQQAPQRPPWSQPRPAPPTAIVSSIPR